ncbi:MAG: GIY-YIG nuclease family protein [Candidatus Levybacteria bacterium]|nr:GIY-YIG nuclease family protein [Candidatus Levybacteria bacterium]
MYYVYVLRSLKNNRLYTGSTDNIEQRLADHNSGRSRYTKLTKPFELIWKEEHITRAEAMRREEFLKTGKGRDLLKSLIRK